MSIVSKAITVLLLDSSNNLENVTIVNGWHPSVGKHQKVPVHGHHCLHEITDFRHEKWPDLNIEAGIGMSDVEGMIDNGRLFGFPLIDQYPEPFIGIDNGYSRI